MKATVLALLLAAPLAGQEGPPREQACGDASGIQAGPRLAPLLEQRKEKCGHLRPYHTGFLEGQALAFEKAERPSITQLNLFGFYPRIQIIDHRSQWALGLRFWQPDLGGSRFDLSGSAFWSLQGFQFFEGQAGVLPHHAKGFPLFASKADDVFELANVRQSDDTPYMLYGSYSYRWAPKRDFFGIGPDSREQDQSDFRHKDSRYEAVAGYRVLRPLTVSGRLSYFSTSLGPGQDDGLPQIEDVFPPSAVPGLGRQPDYLRYGVSAILDTRDVARNPHKGAVVAVEWSRYDPRDVAFRAFQRWAGEGRLYVPLGNRQRVLALRAYGSRDDPRPGTRVPFYLLPYLGGSHTLRGYASQRFRGEKVLLLQAEYRWEASPAVELCAFVDSGSVAARSEDDLGAFKTDGGVGLRLKTHQFTALRLDFAWSDEGFRVLFRFSPSF